MSTEIGRHKTQAKATTPIMDAFMLHNGTAQRCSVAAIVLGMGLG